MPLTEPLSDSDGLLGGERRSGSHGVPGRHPEVVLHVLLQARDVNLQGLTVRGAHLEGEAGTESSGERFPVIEAHLVETVRESIEVRVDRGS